MSDFSVHEYIVVEYGFPGVLKQEIVGELVRCRDCKHWERDVIFNDGWCRGKHQGNPDWFCADGERKENEVIK